LKLWQFFQIYGMARGLHRFHGQFRVERCTVPHVASKANILQSQQHAGLNKRDRMTEAQAETSPFSILLAETGTSPAPQRNQSARTQGSGPVQRSDTSRTDAPRSDAPRSDTQRSQPQEDQAAEAPDAPAADATTAEQPDGAVPDQSEVVATAQVQEVIEATTPAADGASDPAVDEAVTVDAALAATVEIPVAPEQPVAATTPSLAPVAPAPAAPAPTPAPEAINATGAAEPTPAAGAVTAPVATPAADMADDVTEPALPQPQQTQQGLQAPPSPQQAAQGQEATPVAPTTPHAKPPAKPGIAPTVPDAPTETPEHAGLSTAPDSPDVTSVAPAGDAQHTDNETEAAPHHQPAHAEKPSHAAAGPQAPESAERPQARSAVSEFVQSAQPTPDGSHLSHLQTGRDFGQTVAATAHASQQADASNPLVSAPVPLESVAVEFAARIQGGRNRFEIRLDPPELGRIEVRLDIDRSGQVTSRLIVDKVETLDVLRRDAHQLERALQDAGLKTSDNSLQFSLRDQSFTGRNDRGGSDSQHMRVVDPELPATDNAPLVYGQMLRGGSGIDIRV
jgi:flagellar hook-length control protein FliK